MIRRAFFADDGSPRYEAMHDVATDFDLAPHFNAGLADAEGSLLLPVPIESPHGRVFAAINNDRRLLGITRLSLVNKLRIEPASVRTRLASRKGREHQIHGISISTRHNNYLIEILAGGKVKWLSGVGMLLKHPQKSARARVLLATYPNQQDLVRGNLISGQEN